MAPVGMKSKTLGKASTAQHFGEQGEFRKPADKYKIKIYKDVQVKIKKMFCLHKLRNYYLYKVRK